MHIGPLVSTENGKAFLEMDSKPHKAVRQHLAVQNSVSEQLVGGDTGTIFTAFVFFFIAHIHANITYAPVGTICICWSIWIRVLAVSYQLLGII